MADKIEINVEDMTWDDMRILLTFEGGEASPLDIITIFDRFVVGGAAAVPIMRTQEAVAAIIEAMGVITDSKNSPSASTKPSGQAKKRRSNTSS